MGPSKLFEDLTWFDLTIVGDELKAVLDLDFKTLSKKVCGQFVAS